MAVTNGNWHQTAPRINAEDEVAAQSTRDHTEPRGRYFTLDQAAEEYPVFTRRLLRRLVEQRRIAFSRAGRRIVLAASDIEQYLERNRVETPRSGTERILVS
jgi:excisionase family DNA binding protein